MRIFSAAPTKLQSNYRNAQQEIIFHHPASAHELPYDSPAHRLPAEGFSIGDLNSPTDEEPGTPTRKELCHTEAITPLVPPLSDSYFSGPRFLHQGVRLGTSVVTANGYEMNEKPIVVVQNFLPSLRQKGGFPIQIDSEPDDNKSTNHLAVPCLGDNEIALTTTLPAGLAQYYVEQGLIKSTDQVVSFNGDLKTKRSVGFPHFDPLTLAQREKRDLGSGYFASAFTSDYIRDQALELGLQPVQKSDSFLTNDKVGFGTFSSLYGYYCCPRVALRSPADIGVAVEHFSHAPVWVKYSHAFGGDLLMRVDTPVTKEKLLGAIERMYRSVRQATQVNDYSGASLEQLWPQESLLPRCGGITVDLDARYIGGSRTPGQVLAVGSNLMRINSDHTTVVEGYFEQIIGPAGDFWGSCAFNPAEKFGLSMKTELDRQFYGIGQYAAEHLNLFGLVGVDFMIIQRPDGEIQPVMIELNGRPPLSACSHIVGTEKLKAPFWISRYMCAPNNLYSAADFEYAVTINGKNYARSSPDQGAVIPMHLASVTHEDRRGNSSVVIAKNWAQILVAGNSKDHCEEIFRKLQSENSIHFVRPNSGSW